MTDLFAVKRQIEQALSEVQNGDPLKAEASLERALDDVLYLIVKPVTSKQ